MGMEGAGLLYVRPECARALVPRVAGWLSHDQPDDFLRLGAGHLRYDRPFKQSARVFEGSAQNVLGFAALEAALEPLLELGIEHIFEHVQRYHDRLEPELTARGFNSLRAATRDRRSGSLSLEVPSRIEPIALHQALSDSGIACALPDGVLRFSPHWPNHPDEVDAITESIDAALAAQRR
jgi:selenocysteine lyase/cysteine desulfurase